MKLGGLDQSDQGKAQISIKTQLLNNKMKLLIEHQKIIEIKKVENPNSEQNYEIEI